MALALLDSREIPHPPIEAVFTVDEELGMEGAEAIDLTVLKGKKLINLDSEEEKTLTVGCAGGVRYQGLIPVEKETASGDDYHPWTSWRTFRRRNPQTAWQCK